MPDINVWLALSWSSHAHSTVAWNWFSHLKTDQAFFCRFTQIGLLRLMTTKAVMGADCLTVKRAWELYDGWLGDSRVAVRWDSPEVDTLFRLATAPVMREQAPKSLGDAYLLAMSQHASASLVTLDRGLAALAASRNCAAVLLGE